MAKTSKGLTGLWKRECKTGSYYGSTKMKVSEFKEIFKQALDELGLKNDDTINFLVFPNGEKQSDKSPDINLVIGKYTARTKEE